MAVIMKVNIINDNTGSHNCDGDDDDDDIKTNGCPQLFTQNVMLPQ